MPRKPKVEKQQITIVVDSEPVNVILHPPKGSRKSWYAYWNGLTTSKSTGERRLDDAVKAAERMIKNGGNRFSESKPVLTDEEFDEMQRQHFAKKRLAETTVQDYFDAISAFRSISGIRPSSIATPDDCERFQFESLKKPRNWRITHPNSKIDSSKLIQPNTVLKWSRTLCAAFERVNRMAGRKCVRGVVSEEKLLTSNPWKEFTWIDGTQPSKRRFTNEELLSILDYFETQWPEIPVATSLAKVSLWIWGRRSEVASLRWDDLRIVDGKYHFDFIGKWKVRKWARIPVGLYEEIAKTRTANPYVFADYTRQLRLHYERQGNFRVVRNVSSEFNPKAIGDWFHGKLGEWSKTSPNGHATQHAFRKTGLQCAYRGGVADAKVAHDASITCSVMRGHYVDETDEELLIKSNSTFERIVGSLPLEVAERYGYIPSKEGIGLEESLKAAIDRRDFEEARHLLEQLEGNGS
jgi:integrase